MENSKDYILRDKHDQNEIKREAGHLVQTLTKDHNRKLEESVYVDESV